MSEGMLGQVAHTATQAPPPAPLPGNAKPAQAPPPPPVAQPAAKSEQHASVSAGMPEKISTEELERMLNKVNLTFNLFEIESDVSIDQESHELHVIVRNTRTGDVIRRIPAYEFKAQFDSFRNGLGLLIDRFL
jgi:uncharacterized FlaG/YvyC family protein